MSRAYQLKKSDRAGALSEKERRRLKERNRDPGCFWCGSSSRRLQPFSERDDGSWTCSTGCAELRFRAEEMDEQED